MFMFNSYVYAKLPEGINFGDPVMENPKKMWIRGSTSWRSFSDLGIPLKLCQGHGRTASFRTLWPAQDQSDHQPEAVLSSTSDNHFISPSMSLEAACPVFQPDPVHTFSLGVRISWELGEVSLFSAPYPWRSFWFSNGGGEVATQMVPQNLVQLGKTDRLWPIGFIDTPFIIIYQ